ncbi:23S rRNA (guanosine(2251)-2'-O)-methyltransferase RlmB [Methylobacterium frigidaeris]|uniref:TrmH family tRNA/rRNA methyltransferase n=1 Tax=Methylobacterium frigidaeris TaxID=2038277 RepID=A0AA37HFI4_9HYPH|nr:23S rRNA (guanosine(2251)-2'-O)-methyltransferase RlmB [Methylobacterium frigidaeris]PIK72795.1 23S rRNA (guanosine(2251)-2'-O)-methyltransferase RlmB [Methylobacterium frigidaeris]GJD64923.1 Putative TrmH family tRNA/rRNA methyltransferase [Methylobacterium frigidaeris]
MTTRQGPRAGGQSRFGQGKPAQGRFGQNKGGAGRRPGGEARDDRDGLTVLYGWHPVSEALRNPKREFRRLLATENAVSRLTEEVGELRIDPEVVKPGAITGLLGPDAVHQGLYLEAEPLAGPAFDTLPDDAVLLALDQITDPHNVGAIVRTAAAFGVTAIVTTARHSPAVTGVLAKSASGGLEHVPFVVVRNLAEALIELGERGFTRVGLDSEAPETLDAVGPRTPLVVVLGAEGKGLRQRTRECCDVMARIPFRGAIQSLNVSNAAAITLYALMPRA